MVKTNKITDILDYSATDEKLLKALESFIENYKEEKQKNHNQSIPLSLFAIRELGSLEIIVKYMKENLSLNNSQIASIIKRDQRTIWSTYHRALTKHKENFKIENTEYMVPCNIFSERNHGPFETLVIYLKEGLNLSFKMISECTNRDYRTVWLSYKNGKNEELIKH